MKKIICALLAVLTVFSMCFTGAYAKTVIINSTEDVQEGETPEEPVSDPSGSEDPSEPSDPSDPSDPSEPEDPSDPTDPSEPTDPTEPTEPENLNEFAEMHLMSFWNSFQPHVFFYVKNLTDHDIKVGAYTCPAGQGVSVGSFGVSTASTDGKGVYYNLELYRHYHVKKMTWIYNIKKVISKSDLEAITDFILNNNSWEFFLFNCCWFAAKCWNTGGGGYILPIIIFPSIMRIEMLFHHSTGDLDVYSPTRDQVKRQVGEGQGASVKTVMDKTIGK